MSTQPRDRQKPLTEREIELAIQMRRDGHPIKVIAARLKRNHKRVSLLLREHGLGSKLVERWIGA
jgi:DNA-binding NarL/FixJ family response regulator